MHSTSKTTGALAVGTTLVMTGKCILTGVNSAAAAADVTVTIYDALTAVAPVVYKGILDISVQGLSSYVELPSVRCDVGMTVVVAGTGGTVQVHYK